MNASSLRWGISYSALLWALAVCAPQPAVAAPQETVLYSFTDGPDGAYPLSELSITKNGALIGTASQGGDLSGCGGKGCGVVFELTPAPGNREWKETVLYQFQGGADGAAPLAGVLMDKTGALYGATSEGGDGKCYSYKLQFSTLGSAYGWGKAARVGCGTIFKLTPPTIGHPVWTEAVLYAFRGNDGRTPVGVPLIDKTGALYGVTSEGGKGPCGYFNGNSSGPFGIEFPTGCGTVFKLTPPADRQNAWSLATLHEFTAKPDGEFPGGVRYEAGGSLVGTTRGTLGIFAMGTYYKSSYHYSSGTVFKLTPPASDGTVWTHTILYAFTGQSDGAFPLGRLYQDPHGALFGTTANGGKTANPSRGIAGYGTAFQLSPPSTGDQSWIETTLHSFGIGGDGAIPGAGLIGDPATGALFGVTAEGGGIGCGSSGCGTVFSLKPPAAGKRNWTEAVLHRFGKANDGQNPQARLAIDRAGNLYGTTEGGGAYFLYGTVFKVSP